MTEARYLDLATSAEVSWLAKRYSREVPTRRSERDLESLYRRGLVSLVWRPASYWDGRPDPRRLTFCTFATPLGRKVVDAYRRQRRAQLAGGKDAVEARSGPWDEVRQQAYREREMVA